MGCDAFGDGGLEAVADTEADLGGEGDALDHGVGGLNACGEQRGGSSGADVEGLGAVGVAGDVGEHWLVWWLERIIHHL